MSKPKKSPRHLSRSLAVQGLYYYKINQADISEIEYFLSTSCNTVYAAANYELLHFLLSHSIDQFEPMLELYTEYLQRDIKDINLIEQIILVLAAVELSDNLSVPAPVIINEAIELAKLYGATESHKFINNVVDKLAARLRQQPRQQLNTTLNTK